MRNEKIVDLLTKLEAKTNAGDLAWESENERSFEVSFREYSVRTRKQVSDGKDSVLLEIVNDKGQVIDTYSAENMSFLQSAPDEAILERIYAQARLHAMGIDEALDSILRDMG